MDDKTYEQETRQKMRDLINKLTNMQPLELTRWLAENKHGISQIAPIIGYPGGVQIRTGSRPLLIIDTMLQHVFAAGNGTLLLEPIGSSLTADLDDAVQLIVDILDD